MTLVIDCVVTVVGEGSDPSSAFTSFGGSTVDVLAVFTVMGSGSEAMEC